MKETSFGPFHNGDEAGENRPFERRKIKRPRIDYERNRRELYEYFEGRLARMQIVKTTTTPRGQTIDWIPIESQHPQGRIATPPPAKLARASRKPDRERKERIAIPEIRIRGVGRGPSGTVPVLRKKLAALGYTRSLKRYLSKTRGHRIMRLRNQAYPAPEEDGSHRYASSGQSIFCFGGEGQLSCFDPYTESSDDFSLIQIGLSNNDLGLLQTVEAGWQEFQDLTGDWVPHLFWRLRRRPYAALVTAGDTFDALAWVEAADLPEQTERIELDDGGVLVATACTLAALGDDKLDVAS